MKQIVGLSLIAAAVALLLSCGTGMAANLLVNGDFEARVNNLGSNGETGSTGLGWWYIFPSALMHISYESQYSAFPERGPLHIRGTEAVRYTCFTGAPTEGILYQDIAVVSGHTYNASVYVYLWDNEAGAWGYNPANYAALELQQLDASKNPVGGTPLLVDKRSAGTTDWVQLTKQIVPSAQAYFVRVSLHSNCNFGYMLAHTVYDDAVFDGPPATGTLSGTVRSGGIPVDGVTVSAGGQTETTANGGIYSMDMVGGNVSFTFSKSGYYSQTGNATVVRGQITTVNADLSAVGSNLVINPGFDVSGLMYWNAWVDPLQQMYACGSFVEVESSAASYGDTYFHSGWEAAHVRTDGNGNGMLYQWISVQPGSSYTAKCMFRAAWKTGETTSWGTCDSQKAALVVQEFSASGAMLKEHRVPATSFINWQALSKTFTTTANTASVRIGGFANVIDYYGKDLGRAIFDSFELNGTPGNVTTLPPTVPTFFGVVCDKTTGNPVAGAKVEILGESAYTTTTDANGCWGLGVSNPNNQRTVRVSKDGFYAQRKTRGTGVGYAPYPPYWMNFDLDQVGDNLLVNAGFDDGWMTGWMYDGRYGHVTGDAVYAAPGTTGTVGFGPWWFETGEQSTRIAGEWGYGSICQVAAVQGGSNYTAKCKFKAAWNENPTAFLPNPVSAWELGNTAQYATFSVDQIDALGIVTTVDTLTAIRVDDWETLSIPFTTAANAVAVKVTAFAALEDNWLGNRGRAVFDSFELKGTAGAPSPSISSLRNATVGSSVALIGKPCTFAYETHGFYIEEPDRTFGIRVNTSDPSLMAESGSLTTVIGTIGMYEGEKVINPTAVISGPMGFRFAGSYPVPAPIGLINRATSSGLSPVGLSVTMWGRVDSVQTDHTYLTFTDGGGELLKVYAPSAWVHGTAEYISEPGDYVVITGCLGGEDLSESGITVPVLRAVSVVKVTQ